MSDRTSATDQEGRPLLRAFGQRLNELIAALHPDERKRPGYARLAKEIRETTGGAISGTYLWELATGKKRNVTLEQLDVLAEYFGVPPSTSSAMTWPNGSTPSSGWPWHCATPGCATWRCAPRVCHRPRWTPC
ncbi:hypothetical protein [Streptomyces sp. Ac-502]|uniref:hypothetical protein n=1 Tax=Streptomyces sp. Ac-502 TaxID=3342801 RepID=UPI0038626869